MTGKPSQRARENGQIWEKRIRDRRRLRVATTRFFCRDHDVLHVKLRKKMRDRRRLRVAVTRFSARFLVVAELVVVVVPVPMDVSGLADQPPRFECE
jgi:hypothetical protein